MGATASGASITDHATEAGEQLDLFVLVDLVSEPSGQYGSGGSSTRPRGGTASKSILLELATFFWSPTIPGR